MFYWIKSEDVWMTSKNMEGDFYRLFEWTVYLREWGNPRVFQDKKYHNPVTHLHALKHVPLTLSCSDLTNFLGEG